MLYLARLQVGYYDDDDSYHGPFYNTVRFNTGSISSAIVLANEHLRMEMSKLQESLPDGAVLTIHNDAGNPLYDHQIGILRKKSPYAEPLPEVITLKNAISYELIKYMKIHPETMYEIRPRQFEEIIAEILASYGWEVQLTPAIKDGGYDLFAVSKDNSGIRTSWIIECKKYRKDRKVGVDIARALYAVKGELRIANAMLATTSDFTKGVQDFKASRYDFDLRNYEAILEWINEYKPNPNGKLYIKDNQLIIPGE